MAKLQLLCLAAFVLDVAWSFQPASVAPSRLPPTSAPPPPPRPSPRVLTEDNSRYKTIQANSTLLKLLMEPNRDENTRSEIFDMLHSDQEVSGGKEAAAAAAAAPAFPEDSEDAAKDALSQPPNMQAELVQGAGTVVEKDSKARMWSHPGHTHEMSGRGAFYRGAMSGVMVGVTCAVVLLAYLGLVAYRRHEMVKSGMKHELLRNDESTGDTRIEL